MVRLSHRAQILCLTMYMHEKALPRVGICLCKFKHSFLRRFVPVLFGR